VFRAADPAFGDSLPTDLGVESMDRIATMRAFVRVVEAGSFAKAADTLDMPRPTLTRFIKALESELRVRLLQRTTRSVTVTAEGAMYYERVVRLLADLDDIESSTKRSRVQPSGRIRVDAPAAVGTLVVVPALSDFYRSFPEIEIDLRIGTRQVDLVAESVDCAIRAGAIADQSLVAKRIGEFRFVTCASPSYIRARGKPATPSDLERNHETVAMGYAPVGRHLPFVFRRDAERIEMSSPPRLLVNDTNAYIAAGVAGLGVIQAPSYAVASAISSGQLVPVLDEWRTDAVPLHLVFPPNRFLSAKVRVFIDWAAALFERTNDPTSM
jgi:DNA-binding transcriptional LysR family regulator